MAAKVKGTLAHKKAWSQVRTLDEKSRALTTSQSISNSGATNVKYSENEYYILTPVECERLQTLPDNYTEGVSSTQRYKAIGNGWTVDVIAHIFKSLYTALKEGMKPLELKERIRPIQSYRDKVETQCQKKEEMRGKEMNTDEKARYEAQILELKQQIEDKDKENTSLKEELQGLKTKMFNILLEKVCG